MRQGPTVLGDEASPGDKARAVWLGGLHPLFHPKQAFLALPQPLLSSTPAVTSLAWVGPSAGAAPPVSSSKIQLPLLEAFPEMAKRRRHFHSALPQPSGLPY